MRDYRYTGTTSSLKTEFPFRMFELRVTEVSLDPQGINAEMILHYKEERFPRLGH
jgi:hypothetical protein